MFKENEIETIDEIIEDLEEIDEIIEEVKNQQLEENKEEQDEEEQESEENEISVSIGDEKPEEEETAAPDWVKELRKKNREDQKRIRELEDKLKDKENNKKEISKKPSLDDFDYDTDKYEDALLNWHNEQKEIDAKKKKQQEIEEKAKQEWQSRLDYYTKAKSELKVKDFEDAEENIKELFNITQQGILVQGSDNPALLVYALGNNVKKTKELAEITDPVKFAFAISKLETQLKITNKKSPPAPESKISGTAPSSGSVDSTLSRLRADAEKSGDFSKVMAYKQQLRKKSK